jgi:predicted acyl esterase
MLPYLQPVFISLLFFAQHYALASVPSLYTYEKQNVWLSMADGVRLSVTLTIPTAAPPDKTFPVLLEYKPYRKDDNSFNADQATIVYLARRGFIVRANAGS